VRISMPDAFARPVTAMLADLRRRHPALSFDVHCDTRMVDLARREADVAIRSGRSSSEVVVDRHVGRFQMFLYAAPSYVERRLREPRLRLADAARHDFVGYDREWEKVPQHRWLVSLGAERFAFRSNSDDAIATAIVGGLGLGPLTPAQAKSLDVVRVEVESDGPSMPVYVSFHRDLRREPRVRVVVESLVAGIRQALG
jgi:DNA-binding transcriptional LysR family regulator